MKKQFQAMRKIRGALFASGHQKLARGIVRDNQLQVVSQGSRFYNRNSFVPPTFILVFSEFVAQNAPQNFTKRMVDRILNLYRKEVPRQNKIVIAKTPDWVDSTYMDLLDGGLIHECAHSLYTSKGSTFDKDRIYQILKDNYDPEVDYAEKAGLLKSLWNIYEDAYIERNLIAEYKGALRKLQRVHEYVWDLEEVGRTLPVGSVVENSNGQTVKAFQPMDHFTCYLRDRVKHYLQNAPMDEYDPGVKSVVDMVFSDLLEASDHTKDSYDTLELAFKTLNRLSKIFQNSEMSNQQAQGSGDGNQGNQEGDSQKSGDSPSASSEGESNGDPSGGESHGEGDSSEGSDCDSEGSGGSDGQDSGNSDKDGESSKDFQDSEGQSDPSGSDGSRKNRAPNERKNRDDDLNSGEANTSDVDDPTPLEEVDPKMLRNLQDAKDSENMMDSSKAMKHLWDDAMSGNPIPRTVMPLTTEYDKIEYLRAQNTSSEIEIYNEMNESCMDKIKAIRPRALAFFRAQDKTRVKHRQPKGRRLGRNVSEVVYKQDPKPYRTKVKKRARNSAVSLVLDESGSMTSYMMTAREVLASIALTVGELRIPHEIIGFTTASMFGTNAVTKRVAKDEGRATHEVEREYRGFFTRLAPVHYRIFRTFDEPFNVNSYRKLTQTRAANATPLPDAIEFAAQRLAVRSEEQKILIVVTDGSPQYSSHTGFSQRDYLTIMENQVEDFKKLGVEILFVGVGGGSRFVTRYPNSVNITHKDTFAAEFTTFLFEQMKRILASDKAP